jgi:hypothetical protein
MEAEEILHSEWQRKAVVVVAGSAVDADDCRLLLSILGLDADVVADARRRAGSTVTVKPARKPRPHAA